MNRSVDEIAQLVDGTVIGDGARRITGLSGIKEATEDDLTFLGAARFKPYLATTAAAAVLVTSEYTQAGMTLIQVDNPHLAFARLLQDYEAETRKHPRGVHPTAVLGEDVTLGENVALDAHVRVADGCSIGDNVVVYAGAYIGYGCTIGPDTVIHANVVVGEYTSVGARCILHANTSLGSDGFGFVPWEGVQVKIPQVGRVILEDDVEIGANSAVDRATCGLTVIGKGTKIDNLVQIGHNARIGSHCAISGHTVVAGSAVLGDRVIVGGDSAIGGHIEIGDGVTIGGRSGVTQSVEAGRIVSGFPADDHQLTKRVLMGQRRIPDALRRLRKLEERLLELEDRRNGQTANDR